MSYTKLFKELITSSVWCLDDSVRVAWITMLASADQNGEVMGAIPGMARMANLDRDDFQNALNVFLSPDPDSRNPNDEGRRIEKIEGGWRIINYDYFRRKASAIEKREKDAARQKAKYDRDKRNLTHPSRTPHNHLTQKTDIAEAEAEAEAEADTEKKPKEKNIKKEKPAPPDDLLMLSSYNMPENLDNNTFRAAWVNWVAHRQEIKKVLKRTQISSQLKMLSKLGHDKAIAMIEHTITMGWQGLKEPEAANPRNNGTQARSDSQRSVHSLNLQKDAVEVKLAHFRDVKLSRDLMPNELAKRKELIAKRKDLESRILKL